MWNWIKALLSTVLKIQWHIYKRTFTHRCAFLSRWPFRSPQSNWTLKTKAPSYSEKSLTDVCFTRDATQASNPVCFVLSLMRIKRQKSNRRQTQCNQSTSSPSRPATPSCPTAPLEPWKDRDQQKQLVDPWTLIVSSIVSQPSLSLFYFCIQHFPVHLQTKVNIIPKACSE